MAKSKSKSKKQQQQDLLRFVYGLIVILLAVVGMFELGWLGTILFGSFRVLFGQYPQVLFGIIIALTGALMISPKFVKKQPKRYIIALCLSTVAFLMILGFPQDQDLVGQQAFNSFFNSIRDVYSQRSAYAYGGIIGSVLYSISSFLIAREGTIVFVVLLILVIIALIFTPRKIMQSISTGSKHLVKGAKGVSKVAKKMVPVKDDNPDSQDDEYDPLDDLVQDHQSESLIKKMNPSHDSKNASLFIDYDEKPGKQMELELEDESQLAQDQTEMFDVQRHLNASNTQASTITQPITPPQNLPNTYENYRLPPKALLERSTGSRSNSNQGSAKEKGRRLIEVLKQFGIDAELINIHIGPAVTKFEVKPDSNVKISRISSIQDNIMMELAVKSLRIEAPIPGKSAVGIEIPNIEMVPVRMKDIVLQSTNFYESDNVWVALGKNLLGEPVSVALNKMPHLLVAGATGSGKSVCMNSIITSILLTKKPDELKLLLIDPKKVEFTAYANIPHLMAPVISDPMQATSALKLVVEEMDRRYDTFSKSGVRNITSFNEKVKTHHENSDMKPMPWIVVIIDELADLMAVAGKDVEVSIQRITQLARAAGIHLIVATQRPSVDVVTGIIKANIPSRIAFAVSSAVDSRTILDTTGAEKLLGYGDMLYIPMGEPNPTRVQGVYVSDEEVNSIASYASKQAAPQYSDSFISLDTGGGSSGFVATQDDPLYEEAILFVIKQQKASTSFLQRQYRIGYNRAASLIDAMEQEGIIGPPQGSKPREVRYRTIEEYEEANQSS
ncbi:stage III sporulation protein E [Erysipelothrix larvae]|uniref:Stage III sporulation protein E n=1 Tax=Erysipelothrix larvae TaxID=1514105 RepID=A0A0X8GZX4_9FIRM|nr:DNA translocase FtsK [Erysipelothrix larvae]AMC93486.1 stage III sporulation protein E [Erysipelothrix larvae]